VTARVSFGPVEAVPESRAPEAAIVTVGASRSSALENWSRPGEVHASGRRRISRRSSTITVESYSGVGAVEDREVELVHAGRDRTLKVCHWLVPS
jgi:hypothetical protein